MIFIDLNCDLGEGGAFDSHLMPHIPSCNIACGGHFGNRETMRITVQLALKYNVNIGAHPSYEDVENFGRLSQEIPFEDLKQSLTTQIISLKEIAEQEGGKLHHVKPHGALYNDAVHDEQKAEAIVKSVEEINKELILFAPPKSVLKKVARQNGLHTWAEGFADRKYTENFTLVSRQKNNAVLSKKEAVFEQVFQMISEGKITTENHRFLIANFDTICVHSDTKNSIEILRYLEEKLTEKNIAINRG